MNNEFSFLDYLDDYSQENLLIVERAAQFKNRNELAEFIGVSQDTIKDWFRKDAKKKPAKQTWQLLLFQLEATRKGFKNLKELVVNSACNSV